MHKEIQKDIAYTFTRKFFDSGIQQIPISGTAVVYNNGGAEVQASTSLSIDSNGSMSFIFTAANNDDNEKNFKIKWTFSVNGNTVIRYQLFDVVENTIYNEVKDEDLFEYLPDLRSQIFELPGDISQAGTESNGTCSIIQSNRLIADKRNWKGGFIEIYITSTEIHYARITNFTSSTGTVYFDPEYPGSIAASTKFRIRTSYSSIIEIAYDDHVWQALRNKNKLASGYIDSNVTKKLTIFKALEIISLGHVEKIDDLWDNRYKMFQTMYNSELQKFYEAYDINEDGDISDYENENKPNFGSIGIQR